MTFQKFLETWNGKYCEVAGSANAKNQCTDLANAFLRDVLGLPIIEWTNACDFPLKWKYEEIPNDDKDDLPREGDLIIWSSNVGGGAGHISIFIEGNTSSFRSFEQNWPRGTPCHVQGHTYANVIYFLRYNKPEEPSMTKDEQRALEAIRSFKETESKLQDGNLEGAANAGIGAWRDLATIRKLLNTTAELLKVAENSIKTLNGKLASETTEKDLLAKDLKTAKKSIEKLTAEKETEAGLKNQYRRWWEKAKENDITEMNLGQIIIVILKRFKPTKNVEK